MESYSIKTQKNDGNTVPIYGTVPSGEDVHDHFLNRVERKSISESLRDVSLSLRGLNISVGESIRRSVVSSLRYGGKRCSIRDSGGTATVSTEIFNLMKNLIGCGMLSLPYGVASYGNTSVALIPGFFCTVLMGAIFGYYFLLIGRTNRLTLTTTYREAWESTKGEEGSFFVSLVNATKPFLANLAYSMILADTFQSLFQVFFKWESCTRTVALLVVTVVALLPLCLLKNLKVLAPTSIIGTIGFCMCAIVMVIRYFDGTYSMENNGRFIKDLPDHLKPSFIVEVEGNTNDGGSYILWPRLLFFLCMLNEAFVAHYNAPRFYTELKNNTIQRFTIVVATSFGLTSIIYFIVTSFGFLTFGTNADGYILNNYSVHDPLANFVRVSIAIALICTYPVTFVGARDGVLDMFSVPIEKQTSTNLDMLSVILLTLATILALIFHDLGMISAVGGGTLGTIVVFIFPTLMFRGAFLDMLSAEKYEVKFSLILMYFGIIIGIIGVWIALISY